MARNTIDASGWLLEQRESEVIQRFEATSKWDQASRHINMTSNTMRIPRIDDMDVDVIAKGAAYGEDASGADSIVITAAKFGRALRIAEEDVNDDLLAPYLDEKRQSAASSFAKKFDNAALGTNAAANGTTVPFTSLYRSLTTADAGSGYAANDNVLTSTVAALSYDVFSSLLGIVESSDYFDDAELTFIANPRFRQFLRGLKDGQGRPLFLTDIIGDRTDGRRVETVLGIPVLYTNGARVTSVATTQGVGAAVGAGVKGTAGNPLLALVVKPYIVTGDRTPFESVVIPGRDGLAGLTDEDILKVRTRKAAGVTMPKAHAVLELIA